VCSEKLEWEKLYPSTNVRITKSRMRQAGHIIARMAAIRHMYKFIKKHEG
jgi:hypothetical protein